MQLTLTLAEVKALYRLVGHHVIAGSPVANIYDKLMYALKDEGVDPYHLPPVPAAEFPLEIYGNRPMLKFED